MFQCGDSPYSCFRGCPAAGPDFHHPNRPPGCHLPLHSHKKPNCQGHPAKQWHIKSYIFTATIRTFGTSGDWIFLDNGTYTLLLIITYFLFFFGKTLMLTLAGQFSKPLLDMIILVRRTILRPFDSLLTQKTVLLLAVWWHNFLFHLYLLVYSF